eukprot:1675486-Amphidinium_carterae.2
MLGGGTGSCFRRGDVTVSSSTLAASFVGEVSLVTEPWTMAGAKVIHPSGGGFTTTNGAAEHQPSNAVSLPSSDTVKGHNVGRKRDTEAGASRPMLAVSMATHKSSERGLVVGAESSHALMAAGPGTWWSSVVFTNVGGQSTGEANAEEQARVTGRGNSSRAASRNAFFIDSGQTLLRCTTSRTGNFVVRPWLAGTRSRAKLATRGSGSGLGRAVRLRGRKSSSTTMVGLRLITCTIEASSLCMWRCKSTRASTMVERSDSCLLHIRSRGRERMRRARFATNAIAFGWRKSLRVVSISLLSAWGSNIILVRWRRWEGATGRGMAPFIVICVEVLPVDVVCSGRHIGMRPLALDGLGEHPQHVFLNLTNLLLGELRVDGDYSAAHLTLRELGEKMENTSPALRPPWTVPIPMDFCVKHVTHPTDAQVQSKLRCVVLVAHPSTGEIPVNFMLTKISVLSAVQGVLTEESHAEQTAPKVLPPGELGTVIRGI